MVKYGLYEDTNNKPDKRRYLEELDARANRKIFYKIYTKRTRHPVFTVIS